ncbi:MAG: flagellar protein FliS [Lachnospiraceae bacterium]|nr:flagellar protein FliS [Lachnospiraceae bacterium]
MTRECKQQFTLRITQANATQLVVILYEMCLEYLKDAGAALSSDDVAEFREAVRKTRGCLTELMESLDLEFEPAPAMLQLYLFCIRRLAYAEFHKDAAALGEITKVISPLHDAYEKIQSQNLGGPIMGNSQAVYAGLTYGKNSLTENMGDPGTNRGMLV